MGEDLALPIQRQMEAILPAQNSASSEAPAKLFSIGREGAGACTMVEHFTQRFFGRICRVTVKVTVFASSTSASSVPRSQRAAAVRAGALARLDHVIDALEVLGQLFAPDRLPFRALARLDLAVTRLARSASATAALSLLEGQAASD